MAERPLEQLTLRELFTHAERLSRELSEHLDQGFLPKIQRLDQLIRPGDEDTGQEVLDVTVRNRAAELLQSDDFTQGLMKKMEDCLSAIDHAMDRHINQT